MGRWIAALTLACILGGPALAAQRHPRIAVVFWRIPTADLVGAQPRYPGSRVLTDSLKTLGWEHGRNAEILWRSAEGDVAKVDAIMAELSSMPVDVIVATGNALVKTAMRHTRTIPIVMLVSTAPVEAGLVHSLQRPGGNVTGRLAESAADLNGKRLALLKQAAPHATRVAFLHDHQVNSMSGGITPNTEAAARNLGIVLLPYPVDTREQLESALADAIRKGANAMFVDTSLSATAKDQAAFHTLARQHRLPVMHTFVNAVTTGGLMYYGEKPGDLHRRAAFYVDQILRGRRPAEMPVETPSTFHLVVNRAAAKEIGLNLPPDLISLADEVRE